MGLSPDIGDNAKNIRYRVTIQDEDGVIRLGELVDKFIYPSLQVIRPSVIRVLYSALTTTYTQIGSVGPFPSFMQCFNTLSSGSSVDIGISFDGITDHWRIESGEDFSLDNLRAGLKCIVPQSPVFARYYTSTGYVQPTGGTLRLVFA